MGIYQGNLIANKLPAKLQQLYVVLTVRGPITSSFHIGEICFEIPGKEPLTIQYDTTHQAQPENKSENAAKLYQATIIHPLRDLELIEEGRFKVWITVNEKKIYTGGLMIGTNNSSKSLEIDPIILSELIAIHKTWKLSENEKFLEFSSRLLSELSSNLPISPFPEDMDKIAVISAQKDGSFHVFFSHPSDAPPQISIITNPDDIKFQITDLDEFSFKLNFDDRENLETFRVEINPEKP